MYHISIAKHNTKPYAREECQIDEHFPNGLHERSTNTILLLQLHKKHIKMKYILIHGILKIITCYQ